MSCKIKTRKYKSLPVIQLEGEITAIDAPVISKKIESVAKKKASSIIVDLTNTSFIDSYGLGVFIYSWKKLKENNCELIFLNPQDFIKNIFHGTNLGNVFKTIDSLELLL